MKAGWQTKTLGQVLQKTKTINPSQSPEAEFDYIDVSSVSNTTFNIEETQRLKGRDARQAEPENSCVQTTYFLQRFAQPCNESQSCRNI